MRKKYEAIGSAVYCLKYGAKGDGSAVIKVIGEVKNPEAVASAIAALLNAKERL